MQKALFKIGLRILRKWVLAPITIHKITAGSVFLSVIYLVAPTYAQDATAQYQCVWTNTGFELPLAREWKEADLATYDQLMTMHEEALRLRENIFIRTNVNPSQINITVQKNQLLTIKRNLENRLKNILSSGEHEFDLVQGYLQTAQNILLLEIVTARNTQNPFLLAQNYGLELNEKIYLELFNTATRSLPGTTLQHLQGEQYLLTFSRPNVFAMYLRALARRPSQLLQRDVALFETLKCALSITHTQNLFQYKNLIADENLNINLDSASDNSSVACPGLTSQDVLQVANLDTQNLYEDLYRQGGVKNLPTLNGFLSDESKQQLVTDPILFDLLPQFVLNPTGLEGTLSFYGRKVSDFKFDLQALVNNILAANQRIYADADYNSLLSTFNFDILNRTNKLATSCGTDMSEEQLPAEAILRLDSYYLPEMLIAHIQNIKIKLKNLNPNRKIKIIKKAIEMARHDSIYVALGQVYARYSSPLSPEPEDFIYELRPQVDPLIAANLRNAEVQTHITSLATKILASMDAEFNNAQPFTSIRESLKEDAIQNAKRIENIQNVDAKNLEFKTEPMLRAMEIELNKLQGAHASYFQMINDKPSFSDRKNAWELIKQNLITTAAVKWSTQPDSAEKKSFFEQYRILNRFATLTGLLEGSQPQMLGYYWHRLSTEFNDEDDFKDFIEKYRTELVLEVYKDSPMLPAKTKGRFFDSDPLWERLLRAKDDTAAQEQLILTTLNENFSILHESLVKVQNARNHEDLVNLFKRTQTLKVIFGGEPETAEYLTKLGLKDYDGSFIDDLSLQTGVISNLRTEQTHQQQNIELTERLQSEIFSDYLQRHMLVGLIPLGGWVVKGITGMFRFPLWTQLPRVHHGLKVLAFKSSEMMSYHSSLVTTLFLGQIGVASLEKQIFKADLQDIRELYQTEIPNLPGSMSLVSFKEYIAQHRYVEVMLQELTKQQITTASFMAAFAALPAVFNFAARSHKTYMSYKGHLREIRLERMSLVERTALENKIFRDAQALRTSLTYDLRTLGVSHPTLPELRAALIQKNSVAATEAYQRIILTMGTRVEYMMRYPLQRQHFSRGLYGPSATAAQLTPIYDEYIRILEIISHSTGGVRRIL